MQKNRSVQREPASGANKDQLVIATYSAGSRKPATNSSIEYG